MVPSPVPAPPFSPPTQTLLPQLPPRGNPFPHNLTAAQLLSLPHVSILHSSQPAPPDAPSDLNPFRWGLPEWAAGLAPACLSHQPHFSQAGGGEGKARNRGWAGDLKSRFQRFWSSLDFLKGLQDSGKASVVWFKLVILSKLRRKASLGSRVRPSRTRRGQEWETENLSAKGTGYIP